MSFWIKTLVDINHFSSAAYYLILWRVWLVSCLDYCYDSTKKEYVLHWPSFFTSVPEVVPRPEGSSRAAAAPRDTKKTR